MNQPAGQRLEMPDAEVVFYPQFFSAAESDGLFQDLREHIPWRQDHIRLYGKQVAMPRLVAWHGDEGKVYSYSGLTNQPHPWTPTLLAIKARIESVSAATFNSVLLNQYRDGRDSVGWHADNEPELGVNPVIGSVSLGDARTFQLRHCRDKKRTVSLELTHGSYLLMAGATQHHWLHQVAKTRRECGPRINLTYRRIQ